MTDLTTETNETHTSAKPYLIIFIVFVLVLVFYTLWYYTAGPGYRSKKIQNFWSKFKNFKLFQKKKNTSKPSKKFNFANYLSNKSHPSAISVTPIAQQRNPNTSASPNSSASPNPSASPNISASPSPSVQDHKFPLMQEIMDNQQSPRPYIMSD